MITISLEENEISLIKLALKHCMDTCKKGGKAQGCEDCERVQRLLDKLKSY